MRSVARRAPTVSAFLKRLTPERRREVTRLRALIQQHLPAGYEEVVSKNMLVYQVPLSRFSGTYNKQPLWYVALASQKSYLSLHLMSVYGDQTQVARLKEKFRSAGKKLDIGKACIHFRSADDLPLDVVGETIASMPIDRWIAVARWARGRPRDTA